MVRGFGNLMNRVQEESQSRIVPTIGMACTVLCYSDRHAAEVIEVNKSKKKITVRYMDAKAKHQGMTDSQDWELTSNEKGRTQVFKLQARGRMKGTWVERGSGSGRNRLALGYHDHYHDYSF